MKLLKMTGLAVGLLGVIALVVVLAPVVSGQAQRDRQVLDLPRLDARLNTLIQGSTIGVEIRDVDAADVKREKLPEPTGAAIEEVRAGSPAEAAGFRAGDIVVTFDDERVRSARHLSRLIEETPDGRQVDATVVRDGERMTLQVVPESPTLRALDGLRGRLENFRFQMPERLDLDLVMPELDLRDLRDLHDLRERVRPLIITNGRARLGIGIEDLTDQLADYFGTTDGVLITEVDAGTPAAEAGLRAGDVITSVGDQAVRNAAGLRRELARATGDVRVTIVRDRKEQTVTVALDPVEAPRRRIVRRSF